MEQVITLRDAWESCELHPDIALSLIKAGKIRAIRFKQTVLIYKEDAKDWGEKLNWRQFAHLRGKPIRASRVEKKYGILHHTLRNWALQGRVTALERRKWHLTVDEAEVAFAARFLRLLNIRMRGRRPLPKRNIGDILDEMMNKELQTDWSIDSLYWVKLDRYLPVSKVAIYLYGGLIEEAIKKGDVKALRFNGEILLAEEDFQRLARQAYTGKSRGSIASRYQIPDELWKQIEPLLPPPKSKRKPGRPRIDDRRVMTAIFYVLHTGCPWEDLPHCLGIPGTIYNRFQEWRKAGVFKRMQQAGLIEYDERIGLD